jgi:hypothetical protein
VAELADELIERLRQVLAGRPATESELRSLSERAHELERTLAEDVETSETRLGELSADPEASLVETAALLRRVETVRPALLALREQVDALAERSRQLRTEWLSRQRDASP